MIVDNNFSREDRTGEESEGRGSHDDATAGAQQNGGEVPSDITRALNDLEAGRERSEVPRKKSAQPDPLEKFINGYPRLAARMGMNAEFAMFRRFGTLNIQNILYMQSDLVTLELQLRHLEEADSKSNEGWKRMYARDHFYAGADKDSKGQNPQYNLTLLIRRKLREYNEALIQQHKICNMKEPDEYDLKYIQSFLCSERMGPYLAGADKDIWGSATDPNCFSRELVCLSPREHIDSFFKFIGEHAITFLEKCCCGTRKRNPTSGNITLRDDKIFKLTQWITSIIASAFPIISIAVLNEIKSMENRIGAIAGFNILIAVCLLLFTEAKRTEVFSVTAAFAAVQVVFVGTAEIEAPSADRCICTAA